MRNVTNISLLFSLDEGCERIGGMRMSIAEDGKVEAGSGEGSEDKEMVTIAGEKVGLCVLFCFVFCDKVDVRLSYVWFVWLMS